MNPLPQRLGDLMKEFEHVLIPEMNLGQLRMLLRDRFLVDAKGLNKIKGQPFTINEVKAGVRAIMAGNVGELEVNVRTENIANIAVAGTPGGG